MLMARETRPNGEIVYPESDGEPMADNSRQFRWITVLAGNLEGLFRDRADVFVSGNQNWYPLEGHPEVVNAPDVYAVFHRPKGHRSSWKQWEEDGVPMTVVFEILSPSNSTVAMLDKFSFYEDYGVEEYYIYDPDSNRLYGYVRRGDMLRPVRPINGFVSPRLGITFDLSGPELVVRHPNGRPFLTFEELMAERDRAEQQAAEERQRAEQEKQRAEQEKQRAEQAEQRAAQAEQRVAQRELWAARVAELSVKVMRQEATPEEVAELERLVQAAPPSTA
jgi:Uma2 family endonuclease